ncbi:MAG: C10 family peptidase [Bacteroidales bacterium]|nr:C10 family peptidase [Bacteroidales bacterium]
MKTLTIMLLLNIFITFLFAQVNNDTLRKVIVNFLKERLPESVKEIVIIDTFYIPKHEPMFIVFNLYPKGFVIASPFLKSVPIIGYSFESTYNPSKNNPLFNYWLERKVEEIKIINKLVLEEHPFWKVYMNTHKKSIKSIGPLLYSKWDQGKYYNAYCPLDPEGPDGHTLTGCVATAMGQIMYYYRWPKTGAGEYSYEHPVYGIISANFENTYYDFNEMMPFLEEYNHNVALLLHHIGVAVDMDYGPYGSGMWNHKAAYAFRTYFKYHPNTRYIFRDSTTLDWDSLIISNLEQKKPLYYAGWEDTTFTSGHAFVCDGYQEPGYYHFNWGWGGYLDGYFFTNNLNPGTYNFNYCQELIVDIFPDTLNYTYPEYCGNSLLFYSHGTLSSSNANNFYLPNSNCKWQLNPQCGTKINIQFLKFNLAQDDSITIYDGYDQNSNVLSVFKKTNPPNLYGNPNSTIVKTSKNKAFIVFNSNDTLEDEGFVMFYNVQYCNVDTFITNSDTITDGSGECNYRNYTNCRWIISPPNANQLKIRFIEFNLDTTSLGDYIQIYKNNIGPNNLLATLNYQNIPSGDIYIPSGKAVVRFITNSSGTSQGWKLIYENITGTNDIKNCTLTINPNPVDYSTEIITCNTNEILYVYDISGKLLFKIFIHSEQQNIGKELMLLPPGFYYCRLKNTSLKILRM